MNFSFYQNVEKLYSLKTFTGKDLLDRMKPNGT